MSAQKRNVIGILLALIATTAAVAAPVDLSTWTAESYPVISGYGAAVWVLGPLGQSVTETVNGQPTVFYSDFSARGTEVRGTITTRGGDNDFIGFALGFQPGDTSNSAADFLLVDWKQESQRVDFGTPSTTPGTTALAGLALSRVRGVPTADEFWGHVNLTGDPAGRVTELARATNLGGVGYADQEALDFRLRWADDSLEVYVDDVLELRADGSFPDGRLAFYNFSQLGATYSGFTVETIDGAGPEPSPIPGPAALPLVLLGLAGVLMRRRHLGA
jgi:uncharacterized protein (TIGR03382 family)